MGIAIPQVITSDRATGAQVIDGSLGFSGTDQKLERTPGSAGNQQTWTWSSWVKIQPDQMNSVFSVYTGNSDRLHLRIGNSYAILAQNTGSWDFDIRSNAKFRDNEWYHFVCVADFTNSTQNDRAILYVNGERLTLGTNTLPSNTTTNTIINATKKHYIGESYSGTDFEGRMSQVYFIDGQALGPEYFGYTDGLTNTWKPKKYDTEAPTNNPNNNTTWSSNVSASSGSFGSGEEATKGFDGNTSTKCKTDTNGASITITFSGLTVQKLLRIRTNYTNGSGSDIEVNDVSYGAAATASDGEYKTISGFTGALTKIKLEAGASVNAAFSAIEVDGVILQDSTTTNNRTWDSSVTFGTNGFYLPMDGNSPIGQDQSGQGNNWTPVNFGGSVALDSPLVSGARPILNTTQGGSQAGVGVFGSKQNVGYAVTYYDDGGGNKYYIDGVKQATLTGLIRGATYTFNTVALGSTHPFRFSDSDGGSEYTNGVAAITGTATTITIPHDAPNELYYYCTQHTGMGSSITGITTNEKLADQYASHCVLALPLVGATNDICASIACTSRNKTATSSGPVGVTTESNFYSGSYYYGAASNTLQYAEQGDELVFGTGDFTIECWVYDDNGHNGGGSGRCYIFDNRIGGSVTGDPPTMAGYVDSHNEFNFYDGDGDITHTVSSTVGKWWHYAVTREGTTTRMFIDGILSGSSTSSTNFTNNGIGVGRATDSGYGWSGYIQDFRVYKGVAKYTSDFVVPATSPDILPDTPSGVSGGSKLTKITDGAVYFDETGDYLSTASSSDFTMGTGDFTVECFITKDSNNHTGIWQISSTSGGLQSTNYTQTLALGYQFNRWQLYAGGSQVDGSAPPINGSVRPRKWYHLAVVRNSGTTKLYVDGREEISTSDTYDYTGTYMAIGGYYSTGYLLNGNISNLRVIKGTALYTSNFTPPTEPLTNVTNTKLLCCQSPTSASAAVVTPGSITVNGDAAATNFNPFTTDINTVRGQETGYATLNPLAKGSSLSLSNGNLTATKSASGYHSALSTITTPTTGKWFYEVESNVSGNNLVIGIAREDFKSSNLGSYVDIDPNGYIYRASDGNKSNNNSASSYGDSYSSGDVVGVALDLDEGTLTFYKNGISQGVAFSSLSGSYYFGLSIAGGYEATANFGQKPFKFPPPDGFQPLNTANTRPENVIARPDQYVGVATHTGTGSAQKISLPFQADLIWTKTRSHAVDHKLVDSVRGLTKVQEPNNARADSTVTNGVTGTTFNGFTIGNSSDYNTSGRTYVSWCWRAGGNKNTFNVDDVGYASAAAAGLTGGDITPTGASVGTKQGFSIIEFTGSGSGTPSIPHGLSEAPTFIIQKDTGTTTSWRVFAYDGSTWEIGNLNNTDTFVSATETAPTSSLFYANGNGNAANTQIAYLWHDVPGLQKFGVYSGNSNANGSYVELGFRPALLWLKRTDSTGNWVILDTKRNPSNPVTTSLYADTSGQDYAPGQDWADILSNGFKIRATYGEVNVGSYIYCAWAEAPSIDLYGGGANAR